MHEIVIRHVDAAVFEALRRLATAAGTSIEEQARLVLARVVDFEREVAVERFDAIRRRIGRLPGPSSLEYLRQDRDRDND